jgi:hypothetical protein
VQYYDDGSKEEFTGPVGSRFPSPVTTLKPQAKANSGDLAQNRFPHAAKRRTPTRFITSKVILTPRYSKCCGSRLNVVYASQRLCISAPNHFVCLISH